MKRHTSPLLLALLLAAPVVAKDMATGSVGCPGPRNEPAETQAVTDARDNKAARPVSTDSAPREADRSPNRNRPRWHSFIPGMIR
ncbi:hypothetical protein [Pseudomarimonas arenosa]|uniref:Secreted protein n=1 Tax=Pseudomarimonas arenosa TaxID=2774145 RepID=A0AAW3ZTX1_9GAMM|nr:hypothetical protein [Pseudomarimonas arenosa]MBD8527939.1 hypothetical protein [Pseudomarimonas arenosa]